LSTADRLSSRWAPFWVLILALLSFSVGLAELPVQDRDEARYAQASRQMAETGDWIDIRFQDAARHVKPVGVYWMQAAVLELTGRTGTNEIWVHRIPSYLAGALAALALIWAGTPLVGRRAAVLGGVMLATVYMLSAEARTAKTDATLLLTIILAMGAMARAWLGQSRGWRTPAVFWTAMAAGILVKGPLILLPVLTAAAWVSVKDRSLAWTKALRPLHGLGWMLLLTLPWFIAIMIRTDGAFLTASIGGDLAEKITATGEHSGIPPGFYLLTVWATLWPWTILLPLAAVTGWTMRRSAEGALLLGWIVPTWIVFEAVSTKLIHYTLPVYPALLLLAAVPLAKLIDGEIRFRGWAAHAGTVGFAIGTAVFAVLAIGAPIAYGDGIDPVVDHRRHGPDASGNRRNRRALSRAGRARHRRPRSRGDRHGLDPHRRQPARRAGILGHAPPWLGDGRSRLPRNAARHRRAYGPEPRVPVSMTLVQAPRSRHELLRRVVLGVDLGIGAQDGVGAEHEVDPRGRPLDSPVLRSRIS
jgi:4-amino-4-deoxy-L-arabinose transferase-like glycosyltransferase